LTQVNYCGARAAAIVLAGKYLGFLFGAFRALGDNDIHRSKKREGKNMWTIAVILLVLWALGLMTSYTMSGLIHILLVVALVVVLFRVIQGRRVIG
jgi:Family of unknown function (DUF5670)